MIINMAVEVRKDLARQNLKDYVIDLGFVKLDTPNSKGGYAGPETDCDYEANWLGHTQRHFIVHSGELPWQCKICKKKYATKHHCIRHIICRIYAAYCMPHVVCRILCCMPHIILYDLLTNNLWSVAVYANGNSVTEQV